MAKKCIVIIEDSRFIASVYRSRLQGEGYGIQVAADGETGLELVERLEPDLVILDLGLPGMSGVEVVTHLRAQPRFAELPIFVLSGAYSQAIEESWAAGATGVLSKSTDTPNKVVEVLRAALAA